MQEKKEILVEVLFYATGKGCRTTTPMLTGNIYRPHFIVNGTTEYLGVSFITGDKVVLGKTVNAIVATTYDRVDYSALLIPETRFMIAEGGNIVGEGKVIALNE